MCDAHSRLTQLHAAQFVRIAQVAQSSENHNGFSCRQLWIEVPGFAAIIVGSLRSVTDMPKEMPPVVSDEVTEDVASQVHSTNGQVNPVECTQGVPTVRPPLRSGVGKIGFGSLAATKQKTTTLGTPAHTLGCTVARANIEHRVTPEPHSEVRPSEKTQLHRPNLADPELRPSVAPSASQQGRTENSAGEVPRPTKTPSYDVAVNGSHPSTEQASNARSNTGEEERTRICPAAIIENLLRCEDSAIGALSSADAATRVGEIPIEELVMARSGTSSANVGHEDVTRAYSVNLANTTSQITIPSNRLARSELQTEPRVIILTKRDKSRIGWLASLVLVFVFCASAVGWVYRLPLGRCVTSIHASFLHGINTVTQPPADRQRRPPLVGQVTLSISVSPPDAVLAIDGSRVSNPFLVQHIADNSLHEITAEAPGYARLQRDVQFDRDLTVVLALAPVALAPPAQPDVQSKTLLTTNILKGNVRRAPTTTRLKKSDSKANCNPPFVIDEAGIKSYKPECL